METLVRLGLSALLIFAVMFPYGILYSLGRAHKRHAAIAGALIGLGVGLIAAAPGFEPRSATVAAIIAITLLSAAVLPAAVGVVGYFWRDPA